MGVFLKNYENRTKGENRLVIRTKQVHSTRSLPEMAQIFKTLCPVFQAFRHAKVGMLKFISRNRHENEYKYKVHGQGTVVVQLRRHKWLEL